MGNCGAWGWGRIDGKLDKWEEREEKRKAETDLNWVAVEKRGYKWG